MLGVVEGQAEEGQVTSAAQGSMKGYLSVSGV